VAGDICREAVVSAERGAAGDAADILSPASWACAAGPDSARPVWGREIRARVVARGGPRRLAHGDKCRPPRTARESRQGRRTKPARAVRGFALALMRAAVF
jgi:hypothetical protein